VTRTVFFTATTLDGYLADEHDSLDWLFVQDIDDDSPMSITDFMATVGCLVMGSTTYRWVLDHQARVGEPWPYEQPSFVFTHQDLPLAAANVTLVQGEPAEHLEAIRAAAGDRDVWLVGGGDLAAQFAEAGSLDELMVSIAPVTLGGGRPLFPRRYDLRLTRVDRNGAFLCAWYDVVGPGDWPDPTAAGADAPG